MKKILALFLLLFVLALGAGAQNQYWNYYSNVVSGPQSAVSIVYSNDTIYYFQTDDTFLSISNVNSHTLIPSGNDIAYAMGYYFITKGGFKDLIGNCVVYGYDASLSLPSFAVYDPCLHTLKWATINTGHTILDGCAGYDINGAKIYLFVLDNGQMLAVDRSFHIISISTTLGEYYTDISWDETLQLFIATGTWAYGQTNPGIIVDLFTFDTITPAINHTLQYFVDINTFYEVAEHQAMHVKLHNDTLLVFRDLQLETQDIIWLTTIFKYWDSTPVVDSSYLFLVPTHKLVALDMLYDPFHRRLNFLGEFIYCTIYNSQFLAQVDPYNFYEGMSAKQLDGGFAIPSPCPSLFSPTIDIYGSYLNTSNLALDTFHECIPVMIAGAGDYPPLNEDRSVLIETYDISQSDCDYDLPVECKPTSPKIVPYYLTTSLGHPTYSTSSLLPILDNVTESILCYNPNACPSLKRDSLAKTVASIPESEQSIVLSESKQFYCLGFEGDIQYYIYDISGRMVLKGKTYNGQCNPLLEKFGIYILRAIDSKGNLAVKKVISLP